MSEQTRPMEDKRLRSYVAILKQHKIMSDYEIDIATKFIANELIFLKEQSKMLIGLLEEANNNIDHNGNANRIALQYKIESFLEDLR